LIEPMRTKRVQLAQDLHYVKEVLQEGSAKANKVAQHTLLKVKELIGQRYF